MIDMLRKLRPINETLLGLGLLLLVIVVLFSVQPAIQFLSKGFLLLLENPLEGLSFFFLLFLLILGGILIEEREKKIK